MPRRATTHTISGRRAEREILDRLLSSSRSEFLALYGRRRVGKTHLVRHGMPREGIVFFEITGRFDGRLGDQLTIFRDALV